MPNHVDWKGPEGKAHVEALYRRLLTAAAIAVRDHAKVRLSEAYPPPSRPGEPPHRRTGRLRGSVAMEIVGLTARVGTNLQYGKALELGTRRMAARPWLRRSLDECRGQIAAIFAKGSN